MIKPQELVVALAEQGISFFTGVPDSLLKDFCAYVTECAAPERHVIAVNEGSAVGLAIGHHLATGEVPLVYLQNSGLGNTVNPISSLAHPAVYGVPMLLVVGWRGEPGKKDEPQHVAMGKMSEPVLRALEVPFEVMADNADDVRQQLERLIALANTNSQPVALLVRKGTFDVYKLQKTDPNPYDLTREAAIREFARSVPTGAFVVATTGKPSRELFFAREEYGQSHETDLLTVGGMGHASQIALGVARAQPDRDVYVLDGDGAVLMHMGALASIGSLSPKRFRHLVVNNAAHDSVGGQPTVGFQVELTKIAAACGYLWTRRVDDVADLGASLAEFHAAEGPAFLEVRVARGARKDLGRPTMSPGDLKRFVMKYLQNP